MEKSISLSSEAIATSKVFGTSPIGLSEGLGREIKANPPLGLNL